MSSASRHIRHDLLEGIVRKIVVALVLLSALAGRTTAAAPAPFQPGRDFGCKEWHACREMALAAADRGDYESFHDLAWRAVQTGPPKDPALMLLLARAQALSGRPHDALVMLERLAEMGVLSDAAVNDDFARTRQLPGWPELEARIEQLKHSDAPTPASPVAPVSRPSSKTRAPAPRKTTPAASAPSASAPSASAAPSEPAPSLPAPPAASPSAPAPSLPAPSTAAPSAAAPSPRLPPSTPAAAATAPSSVPTSSPSPSSLTPAPEGSRFSTEGFTLGGLAYDTVSRRFLFGDRLGRKLFVVAEGANHAVDFVRADSAGFSDIAAIEIDGKRGDLWVVSAPADGAGTLHKLQLVSGRPLKSFPIAAGVEPVTLVDLAVTPAGDVLVLDRTGPQLLALGRGGSTVERVMGIEGVEAASLAAAGDAEIAYVAHRDGVSRIDLRAKTATRVTAPKSISLAHLEQIRWRRHSLVAIRVEDDGTRRIVRLDLNASGRAVTRATTFQGPVLPEAQTFVAISGDELVYMVDGSRDADGRPRGGPGMADFVAYRVPLR